MPAATKKVTKSAAAKRAASLEKGIAKVKAANAAKRAKVAAKAKPAKSALLKANEAARDVKAIARLEKIVARANGKAATMAATDKANGTKSDTAEAKGVGSVSGSKATILNLIETTKGGVSAAEIAKALGWPRAGGTISRAIKLATFKVAKARDADGVLRYSRA